MHNLSMLAFPSVLPLQHVWHPLQGHCELAKVTLLLRTARLNSNQLFQNPQNPPRALPVHNVILIHWSTFLWDFYFDTCAQVCTKLTHVLSRKVLSLTKPKGKIYKMKSLGHYITLKTFNCVQTNNC